MIENERLAKYFKHYISEVLGMHGQSDIKYKGHFTRIFPVPPAMTDWIPVSPEKMTFDLQDRRLEIETCFASLTHHYRIRTRYVYGPKVYVSEFFIPGEAYSRQALEFHFRELHKEFKAEGLIRLTTEEEEAEAKKLAKKQMMATMYGANAGEFDMALLKKELNNIFAQVDAMNAAEIHVAMSTFNQVKKLAQEYHEKHGKFPDSNSFIGIGMKVAIDPGVPDGVIVAFNDAIPGGVQVTPPPMQQLPKHHPKPVPKQVESYDNSGDILARVVPALQHIGIPCPSPANCEGWHPNSTLAGLIIHLNDSHQWPRSGTDPNPLKKPNIADWIDEVCLIHGLDQSFHPQEEKKPSPRDWASLKKKKLG